MASRPRLAVWAARLGAAAALFAAGATAGWLARAALRACPGGHGELATWLIRGDDDGARRFTNPLLECETAEEFQQQPELAETRVRIKALIERRRADGEIAGASVYFRQLHDGPWFAVNVNEEYAPASLLKIPTLIAVLKRADTDRGLLARTIVLDGAEDLNRMMLYPPAEPLVPGRSYTVEELCRRMAQHSDNNAARLLGELVSAEELNRVLRGLGVYAELELRGGNLGVKSISGFFRVLYNATVLSPEMSEVALEMLSHSSFREGVLAGIPDGVTVSSKYGEAWVAPELHQLHEFAIVYDGASPYLLGVMTRGRDYAGMKRFIAEVSRTIYADVSAAAAPLARERAGSP